MVEAVTVVSSGLSPKGKKEAEINIPKPNAPIAIRKKSIVVCRLNHSFIRDIILFMDTPRWKWYLSTHEAWEAMLKACEEATVSIQFEQYLLSPDKIGNRLINIFIRK